MLTESDLLRILSELGFSSPTPIQLKVFPLVAQRKNVLVVAPTGSGKTESAVVPIMAMIRHYQASPVAAIYITPLRALNRDLESRLVKIGMTLGLRVMVRHGDSSQTQRRKLRQTPPELVITTPETLNYLLVAKGVRDVLRNVRWIVIDEVQEMIDEKRGAELAVVLERVKRLSDWKVQVVGLSATIGDEEAAARFIDPLGEAVVAKVDNLREMDLQEVIPKVTPWEIQSGTNNNLSPELIARLNVMKELIEKERPVLVFTNTRETAEFLATTLSSLFGLKVGIHHGSLSKETRVDAESKFKAGELDALVATSSLELGIDIGSINYVIQYMSPRQATRLLQRVGRSGHRLDRKPRGVIVPGPDTFDVLECKAIIKKAKGGYLERPTLEPNPLDVVAHQIAAMVIEGYRNEEEIFRVIRGAQPFKELTWEEFKEVVNFLDQVKVIRRRNGLEPSRRIWNYFYGTNMIPDSLRKYAIIDVETNSKVGALDEEFAAVLGNDEVFVLAGKLWRVVTIEKDRIFVERTQRKSGLLPSWFGETIPVEREVAKEVYRLLGAPDELDEDTKEKVLDMLHLTKRRGFPIPMEGKLVVEILRDLVVIHSPFGSRGNNTLGALISQILTERKGIKASYKVDPYHIAIASIIPVTREDIHAILNELRRDEREVLTTILERAIAESPQFKWKMIVELQRFGVIDRDAEVDVNSSILKVYVDSPVGKEAVRELLYRDYDVSVLNELRDVEDVVVEAPSPSPFAGDFLERIFADVSDERRGLTELMKRRLSTKEVKVICISCGWHAVYRAGEIPDKCPKCESVFLSVTDPYDNESHKLVKKALNNEKLKSEDLRRLKELRKVASLTVDYGKYAAIALSARGVGPSNLDRVLSKLRSGGEDAFYQAILEAEKNFLKYKRYWQT
ncbi:DEAD/DEAH box helicase [Sulfodiicoccus acidiphilus]|nr:DEAD/DEAH box helicase [Sulfodiicoccus acidiphilus]